MGADRWFETPKRVAAEMDEARDVSIDSGEVHVWRAPLGLDDPGLLSDDEWGRARRLRSAVARRRFVAARATVRTLLSEYVGEPATSLRFERGPLGKPYLREHDLHFSVSHCGDVLLCAIAADMEIGVDVEGARSTAPAGDLAARILSPRERRWVDRLGPDEAAYAVLRSWVRKEAVSKGMGEGLGVPFPTISAPASFGAAGARVRVQGRRRHRWFVWDIPMPEGMAAAVAAPTRKARVSVLDRDGYAAATFPTTA
jgi:4'-phosphopantetheinyl transferase